MKEVTLTVKLLNKVLYDALQQWEDEEVDYAKTDVTCAARQLSFALKEYYGRYALEASPLPDSFVDTVNRHAMHHPIDSNQEPVETALKVLKAYFDQANTNLEKSEKISKVLIKVERVIPLLLRAMQTEDDSDLLEAAVDLLEVHLAKLAELTK